MKHQLASKSVASLLSKASIPLLVLAVGCSSPSQVNVNNGGTTAEVVLETASFDPNVDSKSDYGLYNGTAHFELGVKKDKALAVFPAPKDSQPLNLVPRNLGADFGAFGWETEEQSFGCLTLSVRDPETKKVVYRNLIVLGMTSLENVSIGQVEETVTFYKEVYGPPTEEFPGEMVSYYFWGNPFRRLMISSTMNKDGVRSMTVAIGAPQIMTEMGMSPRQAAADQKTALEQLSQTAKK